MEGKGETRLYLSKYLKTGIFWKVVGGLYERIAKNLDMGPYDIPYWSLLNNIIN